MIRWITELFKDLLAYTVILAAAYGFGWVVLEILSGGYQGWQG